MRTVTVEVPEGHMVKIVKEESMQPTWCSIEDRNPLRCRKRYTDHFPLNLRHAGIRPNRYIQF